MLMKLLNVTYQSFEVLRRAAIASVVFPLSLGRRRLESRPPWMKHPKTLA